MKPVSTRVSRGALKEPVLQTFWRYRQKSIYFLVQATELISLVAIRLYWVDKEVLGKFQIQKAVKFRQESLDVSLKSSFMSH